MMKGMTTTVQIGKRGEDLALEYLLERGLLLMDRNWRNRHREIDLVMLGADGVRIIEVRSLCAPVLLSPSDTVGAKKQRLLIKAAVSYVKRKKISLEVHFDIVSVIFLDERYSVEYIPDAFLPFIR